MKKYNFDSYFNEIYNTDKNILQESTNDEIDIVNEALINPLTAKRAATGLAAIGTGVGGSIAANQYLRRKPAKNGIGYNVGKIVGAAAGKVAGAAKGVAATAAANPMATAGIGLAAAGGLAAIMAARARKKKREEQLRMAQQNQMNSNMNESTNDDFHLNERNNVYFDLGKPVVAQRPGVFKSDKPITKSYTSPLPSPINRVKMAQQRMFKSSFKGRPTGIKMEGGCGSKMEMGGYKSSKKSKMSGPAMEGGCGSKMEMGGYKSSKKSKMSGPAMEYDNIIKSKLNEINKIISAYDEIDIVNEALIAKRVRRFKAAK